MEFLVLGQIPGTDIVLNFWLWILVVGSIGATLTTLISKRVLQSFVNNLRSKKHQKRYQAITL